MKVNTLYPSLIVVEATNKELNAGNFAVDAPAAVEWDGQYKLARWNLGSQDTLLYQIFQQNRKNDLISVHVFLDNGEELQAGIVSGINGNNNNSADWGGNLVLSFSSKGHNALGGSRPAIKNERVRWRFVFLKMDS